VPRLASNNTHSYQESSCIPQPPQPHATPPTPEVPWPSATRVPSLANDDALILDVPEYGFPYSSQQDSLQTSLKAHNVPQVNPVLVQFTDTADNLQFEVRHTDGDALPNTVLDHHDVHTQSSASQQDESSLMATTTTVETSPSTCGPALTTIQLRCAPHPSSPNALGAQQTPQSCTPHSTPAGPRPSATCVSPPAPNVPLPPATHVPIRNDDTNFSSLQLETAELENLDTAFSASPP
jgi:hypothetical protein